MSYIEFFGTIFNIWCVWLAAKGKVLSWPIGIIGVVCYIFLFYQIQLYSDFLEQIYFLITGFWGWWLWTHPAKTESNAKNELKIRHASHVTNILTIVSVVVGTLVLGALMSNIHVYLPMYFPEPASFPYLDAFTTILSFVATILMAKKWVECWYLWILVDIIGIGLYYTKEVKFIAVEYIIFLALATKGLLDWQRDIKNRSAKEEKIHGK